MEVIKSRPKRLLYGKTNKGLPFAVSVDHIVSVTPNDRAEHIAFIKTDDGNTIISESERGTADILEALGA